MSLPFPMQVPVRFLSAYLAGGVVRYGSILKDSSSGRIVGHLVDLGQNARVLDTMPLGPLSHLAKAAKTVATEYRLGTIENVAQLSEERLHGIQQSLSLSHLKLAEIQHGLNCLQLIGSIGAVASIANLGVSVVGFSMVLRRLNRMEHNLNQGWTGCVPTSRKSTLNSICLRWLISPSLGRSWKRPSKLIVLDAALICCKMQTRHSKSIVITTTT